MRHFYCIIILISILLLSPTCLANNPQITAELFLIPEQGFIRVNTEIPLPEKIDSFQFVLFPGAQITSLWMPNLVNYSTERINATTTITVELDPSEDKQLLEISYEGFLQNFGMATQTLGEQSLWYPLFGDKFHSDIELIITIPKDYVPNLMGELLDVYDSMFSIYTWRLAEASYPVIWLNDEQILTEIAEDTSEMPVTLPDDETTIEVAEEDPSASEELLSVLARFDQAINERNQQSLSMMIHEDFVAKQHFITYLTNRPQEIETLKREILESTQDLSTTLIYSHLFEGETLKWKVESEWIFDENQWQLISYSQIPANFEFIIRTQNQDFTAWVEQLQNAILTLNLPWLDYHITVPSLTPIRFIQTIYADISYDVVAVNHQQNQLVLLVKTQSYPKLKLEFSYHQDGSTWKINDFSAYPL